MIWIGMALVAAMGIVAFCIMSVAKDRDAK
jgi:hypothetical protein